MKSAQINTFGGPEVIELVDVPKPKPAEGQVLVKVFASSLNPFDSKVRQGGIPTLKFPFTLGSDVAGVVTEVGPGATNFQVGNQVYGSAIALAGATGAFAELAAVPVGMLAIMPKNLDFNFAAAVVLTGVSATQALVEHMQLKAGQKILIHGGAGGIGHLAIQLAKHLGAYVVTTATGEGMNFAKKMGADEIIDYKLHDDILENVRMSFDAVFDTVGGQVFEKSFLVLKKSGILVSMVGKDEKNLAEKYGVTVVTQSTKVTTERLNLLTQFIEQKAIKPQVDKIFSFDKIKEAFEYKESQEVLGKIVIQIN